MDVRHSIDTMHIKKNVCESMCGTLLQQRGKGKDHENAREDLKDMGIRPELCRGNRHGDGPSCSCNHIVKDGEKRILRVFAWFESTFSLLIELQDASVGEGHENEFPLDEIS